MVSIPSILFSPKTALISRRLTLGSFRAVDCILLVLRRFGLAGSLFLGLALASDAFASEPATRQFDLPADAAEQSLKRFSTQSGLQVVFASEITDGIRTNPVKGDFTPMDAAARLLAGTPLRVIRDEKTGVISVSRTSNPDNIPSKKKARISPPVTAPTRPLTHNRPIFEIPTKQ